MKTIIYYYYMKNITYYSKNRPIIIIKIRYFFIIFTLNLVKFTTVYQFVVCTCNNVVAASIFFNISYVGMKYFTHNISERKTSNSCSVDCCKHNICFNKLRLENSFKYNRGITYSELSVIINNMADNPKQQSVVQREKFHNTHTL